MPFLKNSFSDLVGLLFPELCCACHTHLYRGESCICSKCLYDLPYTDHHLHPANKMARQFWGRIPCNAAMALLNFRKGSKVQHIIHHLKYSNGTETGIRMGEILAEKLALAIAYRNIDLIIPVPLHKKRQRQRGYNQSEFIAQGISQVLKIPFSSKYLLRKTATDSQTKKGRYLRFQNMSTVFEVSNPETLKDMHILLVDDVSTTGATLEACGQELLKCGIKKLSLATIAFVG